MPRPTIGLEPYRDEIPATLASEPSHTRRGPCLARNRGRYYSPEDTEASLSRLGRYRSSTSDVAVTAPVKELYFSTHKDDEAIASAPHTQRLKRGEGAQTLQPKRQGGWITNHPQTP